MADTAQQSTLRQAIKRSASERDDENDNISSTQEALRTRQSMKSAVNALRKYLTEQGLAPTFEEYNSKLLDYTLAKFYTEARQENGELYRKTSLYALRSGISRHMLNHNVDIVNGDNFKESKAVFKAVCAGLKTLGMDTVDHVPCISDADLQKLYNYFDVNDSTGLQEKVFVDLMLYLLKNKKNRGRYEFRNMKISEFGIGTDATNTNKKGLGFVHMVSDGLSLDNGADNVMYERPGDEFCPYKSFVSYIDKLDGSCDTLFQRPIRDGKSTKSGKWYDGNPVGHNALGTLMQTISEKAELSRRYTNSSLNITSTYLLDSGEIKNFTMIKNKPMETDQDIFKDIKIERDDGDEVCDLGLYIPVETFPSSTNTKATDENTNANHLNADLKKLVRMYVKEVMESHKMEMLNFIKDDILEELDKWKKEIQDLKKEISNLSKNPDCSNTNPAPPSDNNEIDSHSTPPSTSGLVISKVTSLSKSIKSEPESDSTDSKTWDQVTNDCADHNNISKKTILVTAGRSDSIPSNISNTRVMLTTSTSQRNKSTSDTSPPNKMPRFDTYSKNDSLRTALEGLQKLKADMQKEDQTNTVQNIQQCNTLPQNIQFNTIPHNVQQFNLVPQNILSNATASNVTKDAVQKQTIPSGSAASSLQNISNFGSILLSPQQLNTFQQTRMPVSIFKPNMISSSQVSYPLGQAMIPPGASIILRDGQTVNLLQSGTKSVTPLTASSKLSRICQQAVVTGAKSTPSAAQQSPTLKAQPVNNQTNSLQADQLNTVSANQPKTMLRNPPVVLITKNTPTTEQPSSPSIVKQSPSTVKQSPSTVKQSPSTVKQLKSSVTEKSTPVVIATGSSAAEQPTSEPVIVIPSEDFPSKSTSKNINSSKKVVKSSTTVSNDDDDVHEVVDLIKHPAPLPAAPPFSANDAQGQRRKFQGMLPPKPILKISYNNKGIVLSWNFTRNLMLYSEIESYQLYSYQEGDRSPDTDLWTLAGELKALPLPMACTLSHFQQGYKYHFAVRAIDVYKRYCAFSETVSILLPSNK
ncbi:uncharacterized protein LOC126809802 [Patella vulgata]|uniref:uncharacterized protein LOC126809802 n=1 Tax=Patella vulgata TaxID=6465 RepID=UPI00218074AC|nr:uncharacterized protein LOC126809802 [Patella vulgata]